MENVKCFSLDIWKVVTVLVYPENIIELAGPQLRPGDPGPGVQVHRGVAGAVQLAHQAGQVRAVRLSVVLRHPPLVMEWKMGPKQVDILLTPIQITRHYECRVPECGPTP